MPKITIDNKEISVENGITILQACENIGIEIPRFCYHERLSIAGNCRMCLVEMDNSPKPVASCAMPVSEGMNIKTNSELVKKARNGVMEFLLINHPLDCPICDQGGECDLQDQAMAYGKGFSRFVESKRAVKDKNLGPLIKTHMTRCIHCTRCVRFAEEVAGIEEIGTTGRGEDTEITTYLESTVGSELSANIIDLCPVGALTSKPYAYIARPWELKKIDSIDLMDAVGSNVRFDTKADKIMRVLPRVNESINEEWISDKTRFAYDGLLSQRLDKGFIKKNGVLDEVDNNELVKLFAEKIKSSNNIVSLMGNIVDCETIFAFKLFLDSLKKTVVYDCRQDNSFIVPGDRSSYLFNTTIQGIDECDLCLLIGCNPKLEAPILNARIRKRFLNADKLEIGYIGQNTEFNYKVNFLGESPSILKKIFDGKHDFAKSLKRAKKPLIILGQGALTIMDSAEIYHTTKRLYQKYSDDDQWCGFNVLQTFAGRVGAYDLNFFNGFDDFQKFNLLNYVNKKKSDLLILFAADEIDLEGLHDDTFIIYFGHHGDKTANMADMIIPIPCFTETEGIFVNLEGRPQISAKIKNPLSNVNESWKFFLETAKVLNIDLGFNNFQQLRKALFNKHNHLKNINIVKKNILSKITSKNSTKYKPILSKTISSNIKNFYMTDSVSRLSLVMSNCSMKNF
tara:strand:- start:1673 stop:3718 length:2046 start_codon:yes stop_codon:yes gene_type:complete